MRLILLAMLAAIPGIAQEPAVDAGCANARPIIPATLSGWSDQAPITAGIKPGEGATVMPGQAALVSLQPAAHLALSPKPTKAAASGSGGTLMLSVAQAGTYRVALGGGAWVDLVLDGKSLASTAHAHGPQCSGIRKMVDFKLAPGTYTIQLSGSQQTSIALMVAKLT